MRIDQDGDVTTWNTGQARVMVKDETGELEVRTENGHRTVIAKNSAGETVFTGPVDTEEQRRALPPPVRGILDRVQKQRFGPEGRGVVLGVTVDGSPDRPSLAPETGSPREVQ